MRRKVAILCAAALPFIVVLCCGCANEQKENYYPSISDVFGAHGFADPDFCEILFEDSNGISVYVGYEQETFSYILFSITQSSRGYSVVAASAGIMFAPQGVFQEGHSGRFSYDNCGNIEKTIDVFITKAPTPGRQSYLMDAQNNYYFEYSKNDLM